MGSLPNIAVSKEDKTLASLNAKVDLMNRRFDQFITVMEGVNTRLDKNDRTIADFKDATAQGFKDAIVAINNTNARITEESKRTRAVTRLWSSFGFGVVTIAGKTLLDKFGDFWSKLFGLLT